MKDEYIFEIKIKKGFIVKAVATFLLITAIILSLLSYSYYVRKIKYKDTKVVALAEGFGNQLYQYAFGYVYAQKTKQKVLFYNYINEKDPRPWVRYFLGHMNTDVNFFNPSFIDRFFLKRKFSTNFNRSYTEKVINLNTKLIKYILKQEKNENFASYYLTFLDPQYFKGYEQDLQKMFLNLNKKYQNELDEKNKAMIKEMQSHKNSVVINIRLGDFLNHPELNICNFDYYKKAMKVFENMPDVHYYIFSDDIEGAKKYFKPNKPHTYVNVNPLEKPYLNLILSASAKHNIISNSTFAMFAAILNKNPNKIVVCPNEYLRVDSNHAFLEPSRHVWHKDWIKIDTTKDKAIKVDDIDTEFTNNIVKKL